MTLSARLISVAVAMALYGCSGTDAASSVTSTKHDAGAPKTASPEPDPAPVDEVAKPAPPPVPVGKLTMDPSLCPYAALAAQDSCERRGLSCEQGDDLDAVCNKVWICDPDRGVWTSDSVTARCPTPVADAVTPSTGCPLERPRYGAACDSADEQRACAYGKCGLNATVRCESGAWQPLAAPCR